MLDRFLSWLWPSVPLPTWPLRELNNLPVIRPERPAKVLSFEPRPVPVPNGRGWEGYMRTNRNQTT